MEKGCGGGGRGREIERQKQRPRKTETERKRQRILAVVLECNPLLLVKHVFIIQGTQLGHQNSPFSKALSFEAEVARS